MCGCICPSVQSACQRRLRHITILVFGAVNCLTVFCVDAPGTATAYVTSAVSSEATVAEAFLRMFVETCGHYDTYINTQQNGEKIFQVDIVINVHYAVLWK